MIEKIEKIFAKEGVLSQIHQDYEYRESQHQMALQMTQAFLKYQHLMIEAGTGIGKTLAYLIPAALWAFENQKRVIISTNSLHLQDQILNKEMPTIHQLFSDEIKIRLFKGRENYLCLRKLYYWMGELIDIGDLKLYEQIEEFVRKKDIGEKSKYPFKIYPRQWDAIASKTSSCIHNKCEYFHQCYYFKARKEIQNAHIVVVNHHLLLSHLVLNERAQHQILPKFQAIIIDEAHELDKAAMSLLGSSLSHYSLKRVLEPNPELNWMDHKDWKSRKNKILADSEQFFKLISKEKIDRKFNEKLIDESKNLKEKLAQLINTLHEKEEDFFTDDQTSIDEKCLEIQSWIHQLTEFENQEQEQKVYWVEQRGASPMVSLESSYIDVNELLKKYIYFQTDICVLLSGTLKIFDSFDYKKRCLGSEDFESFEYKSPYDYTQQMKLHIDSTMPEPKDPKYEEALFHRIVQQIEKTQGGNLVLFTNLILMEKIFNRVTQYFKNQTQYQFFMQGVSLEKYEMIENFKQSNHSVLFGVNSFWTGIDIKGEVLRSVIMTRLPFAVPDHPLVKAKIEKENKDGRNGFKDYYLSETILRFLQGSGRLIRSGNDQGDLVILDSRILKKSYGKYFIDHLNFH